MNNVCLALAFALASSFLAARDTSKKNPETNPKSNPNEVFMPRGTAAENFSFKLFLTEFY